MEPQKTRALVEKGNRALVGFMKWLQKKPWAEVARSAQWSSLQILRHLPHASASLIFIRIYLSESISVVNNSLVNNFLVKLQLI